MNRRAYVVMRNVKNKIWLLYHSYFRILAFGVKCDA
jgi:hypothetical protein